MTIYEQNGNFVFEHIELLFFTKIIILGIKLHVIAEYSVFSQYLREF